MKALTRVCAFLATLFTFITLTGDVAVAGNRKWFNFNFSRTWYMEKTVTLQKSQADWATLLMSVTTTGYAHRITVVLHPGDMLALTLFDKDERVITRDIRPVESIVGPFQFYGVPLRIKLGGESGRVNRKHIMSIYCSFYAAQNIAGVLHVGPIDGRLGRLK